MSVDAFAEDMIQAVDSLLLIISLVCRTHPAHESEEGVVFSLFTLSHFF